LREADRAAARLLPPQGTAPPRGRRPLDRRGVRADPPPGEIRRVMELELKSKKEVERMRRAGQIVAEVLARLQQEVKPGVTTLELDRIAEEMTRKRGAVPAFKGYQVAGRVFPASLCVSINDEVVHGIPSADRVLQEGDIIGCDFGVVVDGYYG